MGSFANLIECLQCQLNDYAQKTLFTFLQSGEDIANHITYQQLDILAKKVAGRLQEQVLSGERAVLLYPISLDYLIAFFACLYAGVIPIPVLLPQGRNKAAVRQLEAIVRDSEATVFLTNLPTIKKTKFAIAELSPNRKTDIILTDQIEDDYQSNWKMPLIKPDDIAFLQYTSGSTGNPKGVMVTHNSLLHNQALIKKSFQHSSATVFVSWLPFYHDMGIIGNVIQPLYLGASSVLMPPMSFLQKPVRWLNVISKHTNVTSGGPNFAYELCCNRITDEQMATIDLRGWAIAFNGSERVSLSTLNKFSQKFAHCGFSHNSFYPTYGLAEATLFVSGGLKDDAPKNIRVNRVAYEKNSISFDNSDEGTDLVASGNTWADLEVLIVNPDTKTPAKPNDIGEVWIKGDSVAKGYWNRAELTKEKFNAYLVPNNRGPFLRTGDLGYMHTGQLYITGRIKDLIIIRGKNYYPEDIETSAQAIGTEIVRSGGAAFSVIENDEENLILMQEVERNQIGKINYLELTEKIKTSVLDSVGVQLKEIILLKPFYIPRTTSGKIKRSECKQLYIQKSVNCLNTEQRKQCELAA